MNHIKERWLAARIELHWMYIIYGAENVEPPCLITVNRSIRSGC